MKAFKVGCKKRIKEKVRPTNITDPPPPSPPGGGGGGGGEDGKSIIIDRCIDYVRKVQM